VTLARTAGEPLARSILVLHATHDDGADPHARDQMVRGPIWWC